MHTNSLKFVSIYGINVSTQSLNFAVNTDIALHLFRVDSCIVYHMLHQ